MRSPSFVPPDRIIEEYDQVLAKAVPTSAGTGKKSSGMIVVEVN
jgi:hypothetical protein